MVSWVVVPPPMRTLLSIVCHVLLGRRLHRVKGPAGVLDVRLSTASAVLTYEMPTLALTTCSKRCRS